LASVYFIDSNTGYVVGGNSTILKTINGGTNWSTQTCDTKIDLNTVCFIGNTGYAVGNNAVVNGGIIKNINGGGISITTDNINDNVLKIYPNPNNGKFTIEFNNPESKLLKINITDIAGRTIFETNSTQEIYKYSGKELTSGAYMITVMGDDVYCVGKFLVR